MAHLSEFEELQRIKRRNQLDKITDKLLLLKFFETTMKKQRKLPNDLVSWRIDKYNELK